MTRLPLAVLGGLAAILASARDAASQAPDPIPSPAGPKQDQTSRGDRFFSSGKLEDAAVSYREALEDEPDPAKRHRNRFLLACILFELGDFEKAAAGFQSVLRESPEARVSGVLSLLSERRIARPDESIGDAVEAVILPALPSGPGQSAWEDPVVDGLTAEVLFGTGPLHIDPMDIGALIENHADDPEMLFGASSLLRGERKSGLLDIARKKFPDSPALQLNYYFTLRFPERPPSKQPAMEALGATILRDPDNALPRYLRIGIRDYSIARDPVSRRMLPYPGSTIAEIEQINELPRHDAYARERIAATRRVLGELGHPFRFRLIQANFESVTVLQNLLQRLAASVQGELGKGNLAEAKRIERITLAVIDRCDAGGGSTMRNVTSVSRSVILAHFSNYHELRGELEQSGELKAQLQEVRKRAGARSSRLVWPNVAIIPIPSVSNHAVERVLGGREEASP